MVRAVINNTGGTTAKINTSTSSGPQQVSVAVPSISSSNTLRALTDVNATTLVDGALIQYDSATDKFVTKTTIETTTGTLRFNGGNF
jgi:phage baseplate assembly protein gpV